MLLSLVAGAVLLQEFQMPGVAIAERIYERTENATTVDCDTALSEADTRNAEALFTGAGICSAVVRDDDATFLVLAAQARASADMQLVMPETLPPADANGVVDMSSVPEPPLAAIDLFGFIYGYGGGAGPTDLYRDEARTERLFARLRGWRPVRPDGYDPGWDGSRIIADETYSANVAAHVSGRIDQLSPLARLYRDDAYFELQQALEALLIANDNTFHEGTSAQAKYEEIEAAMARRRQELGIGF
jgi:hypothetical protein